LVIIVAIISRHACLAICILYKDPLAEIGCCRNDDNNLKYEYVTLDANTLLNENGRLELEVHGARNLNLQKFEFRNFKKNHNIDNVIFYQCVIF
jgi:hypothetical protein